MAESGDEVAAVVRPGSAVAAWLSGMPVRIVHGTFQNALDVRGMVAVSRAIRRFRPDWIIGSVSKEFWPLAALARAAHVRLALFKHMDFQMRPLTKRYIPRLADRFIVISDSMRQSFIGRGVDAKRLTVLRNPIDTRRFRPDAALREQARSALGYDAGDVVVGYLGRLSSEKGIYALADALDAAMLEAPALRALWTGNGPDAAALGDRLAGSAHADRHRLRPFASDVRPVYAALDVLAVPSLIAESFGRVAAEAEACGVPVLASHVGGIPEAMQDGVTGLLLPPGDTGAWAKALIQLARDPVTRARMGAEGPRLVASRFEARVVAEQFRALLRTGTDGSGSGRPSRAA